MDIGQTLSNTFSMAISRIVSLAGLWAVFFIAQMLALGLLAAFVGGGMFSFLAFGDPASEAGLAGMGIGMILGMFIFYGLYLLLYGAQTIAMTAQASPLLEPNFGRSFSISLRGSLTFFAVMILLLIVYFVGALLLSIFAAILSFLGELAGTLLVIVLLPLMVYFACRLMIIPAVIAVEEIYNPITVIKRAWQLTRGNVLGILVALLALAAIFLVLFGILFLVAGSGITALEGSVGEPSIGMIIVVLVAFLVVGILATAISASLVASVHAAVSDSNAEELSDTFA